MFKQKARNLQKRFFETSAKYHINVCNAFCNLVREIRKYNKDQQSDGADENGRCCVVI